MLQPIFDEFAIELYEKVPVGSFLFDSVKITENINCVHDPLIKAYSQFKVPRYTFSVILFCSCFF